MIRQAWNGLRDRLVASDPGLIRLRLAASAVTGIGIVVAVLAPLGFPLTTILVGAIGAMMSAFTVNDDTKPQQAVTLVLVLLVGAVAMTVASFGSTAPPVDSIVFVLLIFVAVYAQRFGPKGIALGSFSFFLFFFSMFLQAKPTQVPTLLLALATGLASNAVVRFVVLPRRVDGEFLRLRKAFRARLGAVIRAAENYLADGGERNRNQLRRAYARMHECVLLIEDTAPDVVDGRTADLLRRRAIEVELAVQWLAITTERTADEDLSTGVRAELVAGLRRFRSLIERNPRDLPLISATGEFSKMLVEGSRMNERPRPGDELRRAIAELALADVNAQRIAERDYSAEEDEDCEESDEDDEKTEIFAYDNQTRSAIQAVIGGGLAVIGGELVSHQRWYWAVLTVFVVFIGASTAGATFVKGARRLAGTLIGIIGGVVLALLVTGNTPATLALILVCVFGMVYMSRVSQVVMAFFITSMLGLLYSLLGTFSLEVLWIRVAETAVGALAGILAAVVIVPVRTRSVMLDDVAEVLEDLREFLTMAVDLLSGKENGNLIEQSRELDRDVEQVRTTLEPLTHPINVSSARRDYGWYVLTTLETIAFRARHVAARAQPGLLASEERFDELVARITGNVDVLLEVVRAGTGTGGAHAKRLVRNGARPASDQVSDPQARAVLASLDQLDAGVIGLGRAFGVESITGTEAARSIKS